MKGLVLGLFIVISCSIQCKNKMNQWTVIQAKGLKKTNEEFKSMLFLNAKDGFLFGTEYSDDIILNKKFNEQSAVIYRTRDGGKNWIGNEICKGEFVSSFTIGDTVFALGNISSKASYALKNESFLYVSNDKGVHWNLLWRFPFFVRNIFFVDRNTAIAIGRDLSQDDRFWHISKTIDGGKNWHEIYKDNDIANPLLLNSDLWYLSKYPVTDSSVSIYTRVRENNYKKIGCFSDENLFPQRIYTSDETITLIATTLKQFSVDYKIYTSVDSGKTWQEDKLPIPELFKPIAFYKNRVWGYAGAGRLQTY